MHNYVKVEGKDGLVRDMSSQAIINTNSSEYDSYIRRRDAMAKQIELLNKHESDINNIKTDLTEIKQLLLLAIKGNN